MLGRDRGIVAPNLPRLARFFAAWPDLFDRVRPRAGSMPSPACIWRCLSTSSPRSWQRESVLILPGTISRHPGNYFRLGFGRHVLPEALAGLERCAARLRCRGSAISLLPDNQEGRMQWGMATRR